MEHVASLEVVDEKRLVVDFRRHWVLDLGLPALSNMVAIAFAAVNGAVKNWTVLRDLRLRLLVVPILTASQPMCSQTCSSR